MSFGIVRALPMLAFLVFSLSYPLQGGREGGRDEAVGNSRLRQALRLYQAWVEAKLAYERIPGISLALVADQELLWAQALGYADLEERRPTTTETLYSICSISKLFTSLAILQLRDAGRLRLDDPVAQHLPEFRLQPLDPEAPPVTIRALLTHSAGLPRESNHPYWTGPEFPFPPKEEVIKELPAQRMLYPPERYFQYSNLGMSLLGYIVEKVSGQSYEDYVRQHLLDPLGLKHTTPYLPEEEKGKSLATGYGILGRDHQRPVMPFFQTRGIAPAAGYASNVLDLASFASWQFRLLKGEKDSVLSPYTLREMQRVHWIDPDWKTTWGLGFSIRRVGEETLVGHGGSCPGYRTQLLLSPKRKLAGIAMINAMGVNPSEFVIQLLKVAGAALEKPEPKEGEWPDLGEYAGLYRSAWGEEAILPWEDGLAALDLPAEDILENLTRLKRVSGDTFRRIRRDDGELAEEVIFERDRQGRIVRLRWHGNYSEKVP